VPVVLCGTVDGGWLMVDIGWWSGSHRPSGKNNVVASAFVQPTTTAGSSQQLLPTRIFKLFLPCPNTTGVPPSLRRFLNCAGILEQSEKIFLKANSYQ